MNSIPPFRRYSADSAEQKRRKGRGDRRYSAIRRFPIGGGLKDPANCTPIRTICEPMRNIYSAETIA